MTKQIVILDSTQIDSYLTCPTQWLYGYHNSLELIQDAESENNSQKAIRMGTMGHLWLEYYYQQRASRCGITPAVEFANMQIKKIDELDSAPGDQHQFPLDNRERNDVYQRLQHYWMTYSGNDFIPTCRTESTIKVDSEKNLIDVVEKIPLVEMGFSYELFDSPEYHFILEGRIDLIAPMVNTSDLGFIDHKFQLRERQLYPKSIQFKNYALVTGLNLGVINYIRLHQTISNKTLQRQLITFSPHEIKAWRSELIGIFINVAKDLKDYEKNPVYNNILRNRSACPGEFGYPCQFTHVCEEPNRNVGLAILEQRYKQKKEWKPW